MIGERYTLEREIGRGGMGAVWLGRDEVLERPVAIKRVGVMPGGSDPDLRRAEREARIAASLSHPHIVGVFDLVEDGEQQWLVMEYVAGTTLAEIIRSDGPLSAERARPLLAQAASALAAAHTAGIVHRDVKPSNILVTDDGQVKLSDFGIARAEADASLTQTGLVTGSPAYLAPEVASGQLATPASDVWALGATAYHALAGRTPYDVGDNVLGALYRIVNEPAPALGVDSELAPLVEATMVHDLGRRWSMAQVSAFLEGRTPPPPPAAAEPPATAPLAVPAAAAAPAPAPAREPVAVAPTPGAPSRHAAPARRSRGLPITIGVLVLALVAAIVLLIRLDDPQPDVAGSPGTPSDSPSDTPSETGSPSDSPTNEAPTTGDLRRFVASYLITASTNPAAGFRQLTPEFQAASPTYDQFWGSVSNPQLIAFTADVDDLTVSYTYRYERDGREPTDQVELQLVEDDDGGFLIAGEA